VPFVDSTHLPTTERLPGWKAHVFQTENMTFAYYEIAADALPSTNITTRRKRCGT
jgi:hypothetical protein